MKKEPTKVLLIEDDLLYTRALKDLISSDRDLFEFEVAGSLKSAMRRLTKGGIDLVLMDMSLPDSEGVTTIRKVCDHSPNTPLIVLTAHDDEEIALKAVQAGAQDYLVKGQIDYQLLRRAMRYTIERRRSELALRESQAKIQLIADSTPEIIALYDLIERKLTYVNRQVEKILGYSPAELQNIHIGEFIHPEDIGRLAGLRRPIEMMELGDVTTATYRCRHASGEWRWLTSDITVFMRSDDGEVLQILANSNDVTERKLSEEALRASEERYRDLFENANDIVFTMDLKGHITSVNRAGEALVGYSRDEVNEQGLPLIVAPEYLEIINEMINRKLGGDKKTQYEIEIIARGGNRYRLEVNSTLLFHEGKPVGIQGIARDITERKRYEERLREQAELIDCAQDAITVQDLEGRILFWSKGAERVYGWTSSEVAGTRLSDWMTEEVRCKWNERSELMRRQITKRGEWMGELEHCTRDGRAIIVESRCVLMRDAEDKPKSILVINTDVTEKKKLETQFLRIQRLESIGSLASGIAHDLNNWLSPIMMALHTLQQRFTDPNSQKWLSLIRKSTERSRDLIDQVLTFAKGTLGDRVPLNTKELITDATRMVGEILPRNVELDVDLSDDLWSIVGDATQIHQVLMNLCINARDAMPSGGKLLITAANVNLSEDDLWMISGVKEGNFVQLSVVDSGVGMPPELIDRAFEPFFTTKANGLGSGLGLSTALGIVRGHGGFINVASAVGKGSQFRVYFPASDAEPPVSIDAREVNPPLGDGQLIMVVDDEPDVREMTRATLESFGYRTLGAKNDVEALTLYDQHGAEIKLVLADVGLSHYGGISLGAALRNLNPQIKIIVTSGLHSQEHLEAAKRAGIHTVLWKPYSAQQLLTAMAHDLN
jgi:PAS domain S-box-containing protein